MRVTTFLLIRHALTDAVGRRIAGWLPGIHLTAEGQRQAHELVRRLDGAPIAAIYSSPLERACETAAPLARQLGIEVQTLRGVGEIDFGEWTGRELSDLDGNPHWRAFNELRSQTRIPSGELISEVQGRAVAELVNLQAKHPRDLVAVVSHGDVIKTMLAHYAGIPLDLAQRLEISPASVSVVAAGEQPPQILSVNDTGDLGMFWANKA
jgi:probable phosphomutase (TIGR03848 family)